MTRRQQITVSTTALAIGFCIASSLFLPASRVPLFSKVVSRGDAPYSGTWAEDFEVRTPTRQFVVHTQMRGQAADLRLDLREKNGPGIVRGAPIPSGSGAFSCARVANDTFQGTFTIRVREQQVTGKYSIEISPQETGITPWQWFLFLFISLFVLTGAFTAWQYRRIRHGLPTPALLACRLAFLTIGMGLFVLFLYLLLHEGGHALAALSFGSFDLHGSDFFGLRGSPHSGVNPNVLLTPWQRAIHSIAGPLLPVFTAYLLFGFGRSKRGELLRGKSPFVDALWSLATLTLLASALGLLLPVTGLGTDGDYSGFVNSAPVPLWQANLFLLACVLFSAWLVYCTLPELMAAKRRWFGEQPAKPEPRA